MGIKNLFKIIKDNAPKSITYKNINDYSGNYIVLDAHMVIYQYVIAIRGSGSDLENSKGMLTSHILGVISKSLMLLKNNIIPIFVFDGKAPKFKSETLKKRKTVKMKNQEKYETCKKEDKVKYFKRSYVLKLMIIYSVTMKKILKQQLIYL